MIVADASAILELLLQTDRSGQLEESLLAPQERLHAPHLIDVEVTQALRRMVLAGQLQSGRAELALEDFHALNMERHPHMALLARAWQLRDSLTGYDGVYVALAEALDSPLVTCDARLARAHGHGARVQLIG